MARENLITEQTICENIISSALGRQRKSGLKVGIITSASDAAGSTSVVANLAKAVKRGVADTGATAYEIPVVSVSNDFAATVNLSAIDAPACDAIVKSIELANSLYNFDAFVFIPCGESSIKGMMLAAIKLNLPCLFVNIGSSRPVEYRGRTLTKSSIFSLPAEKHLDEIDEDELDNFSSAFLPTFSEGEGMYTANALSCMLEVLNLSIKYNGTAESGSLLRTKIANDTGKVICDMASNQLVCKKILSKAGFLNAFTFALATNADSSVLKFLMKTAKLCGYEFSLTNIEELSEKTPLIVKLYPAGEEYMHNLHAAGGVLSVLKSLSGANLINMKALNYLGESIEATINSADVFNAITIRPATTASAYLANNPVSILYGNLAEKGAFLHRGNMFKGLSVFSGNALVYNSEEEACRAIYAKRVRKGNVIVVLNQGQQGAPGLNTLHFVAAAINAAGLTDDVALITDGAASSLFRGITVSEIAPESATGELFALIRSGDVIDIDIADKKLTLKIISKDIQARRREFIPYVNKSKIRHYFNKK